MNSTDPIAVWSVHEGAMVAPSLDPEAVRAELARLNAVCEIDWYPQTPHLIGLNVLANTSGGVAALDDPEGKYRVGTTVSELVRVLAQKFTAEVSVGEFSVNCLVPGAEFPAQNVADSKEVRVVELTTLAATSVPFSAAVEGVDIGCVELGEDWRAICYVTSSDEVSDGVLVSSSPAIGIYVSERDQKLVAVPKAVRDDTETTIEGGEGERLAMHSWQMRTAVVPGAAGSLPAERLAQIRSDLGHDDSIERVSVVYPNADAEALHEAFVRSGREGLKAALEALGAPADLAAFLYGKIELNQISNVQVYPATTWREALKQSVDIKLRQPEEEASPMWAFYRKTTIEKPWIAGTFGSLRAAAGLALTILSSRARTADGSRTRLAKFGTFSGIVLMAEPAIQALIAKYLSDRAKATDEQRK